jgi:hypothetical protein
MAERRSVAHPKRPWVKRFRPMNFTAALAGFALLLAALGGAPGARCDELVQVAPHRAAAGLARSDGTPPLLGYLARPDGPLGGWRPGPGAPAGRRSRR